MTISASIRQKFGAFVLDVSFRVDEPGITALFGPSGAGKTTTAHALAGLVKPREGHITIGDRVVLDTRNGVFVPPSARRIGYVFQDARLFPHMSVEQNLRFGWLRSGRASPDLFAHVVHLLGLEPLLGRKPVKLSGGEKSRVALGRALLASPELLLLDEPLAALDAPRKAEILPYLEKLRDEARLPMIYVTHSVEELGRLANQVIVIRDGRVTRQGRAFDLLSDLEFSVLTGISAYGAVIPVRVSAHRLEDQLTTLSFDGGELVVPRIDYPTGTELRVRIRAEDVLLARDAPSAISANNVLAATVAAIRSADAAHADVQLACGGVKLVARITQASRTRLNIAAGQSLFAVIKSVTFDPRAESPAGRRTEP